MEPSLPRPHFDIRAQAAFPAGERMADEASAEGLGGLLIRAGDCLQAAALPQLIAAGLNTSRFNVLEAVQSAGPEGCSQADVANRLLLSESNLSSLLDRMHADGLLIRERSRIDRRKTMIRLTSSGEEGCETGRRARSAAIALQLQSLDDESRSRLASILASLVPLLEKQLHVRTPVEQPRRPATDSHDLPRLDIESSRNTRLASLLG